MFDYASTTFSGKERVEIILKEYDTLRTEIIQRTSGGFQLVVVGTLLFTALLAWASAHQTDRVFWCALVIVSATIIVFFWVSRRDINALAERVREIESEVNRLSGSETSPILRWETEHGAAVTGWICRGKSAGSRGD